MLSFVQSMISSSSSCLVLVLSGFWKTGVLRASFTSHFTSATEHLESCFLGMRLYSFLSSFEAVLRCTGMKCCSAKWDAFPLNPDSGATQ